ncbi:MAG TPA: SUMF1/EgtB/PvdO family nonheme iron enzyme [Pseudomonadota bacterium]|nr:SUMF1/EgtB/PvdO family nonheme iron enzyme [Pseudomonadota bacterium]
MLPSAESLQTWLTRVDRDVLRLGTREHLIAARIRDEAVAQGWSQTALGDALASALATDRDTWRELRRVFDVEFAPRPAPPPPRRWPRIVAGGAFGALLLIALWLGLRPLVPSGSADLGSPSSSDAGEVADLGTADLRPPPVDQGCRKEPIVEPPRSSTSTTPEPVPVAPLSLRWMALLALGVLLLCWLAVLLLRLPSYLRRRLAEQEAEEQLAAQRRKKQEEDQLADAQRAREHLVQEALTTGAATRPQYHIDLQPPFGPDVVEDSATLLGRAFMAQSGRDLDIDGTLHATIERGGAAQPVFLPGREVRELCVLYDDTTTRPYLPGFLKLVERWQRLGVRLSAYRFSRHPTTLTPVVTSAASGLGTQHGPPVELADLLRQREGCSLLLFANRLVVRTPTRELDWPRTLRQAAVCAWLDPDPRLDAERDNDTRTYLEFLPQNLPRMPFTEDGLLAAARYIGTPAEGARPPSWSPPPTLADPQMARWVDVWLGLGALVPDAALNQLEVLRQKLLSEALPDPRSIGRLVERLTQLLGPSYSASKPTIELSRTLRTQLLLKLFWNERALFRRGCAMLLDTIAAEPVLRPGEAASLVHHETRFRRAWYEAGIAHCDGQDSQAPLDRLRGTASHEAAHEAAQLLTKLSDGPSSEPVLEVVSRPPVLTWPMARIPTLLWQSALVAALFPLLFVTGLRTLKTWPRRTVAVTTTYQRAQKTQPDEQVTCPNRPKVAEPEPEVVAVKPPPVVEIKKPAAVAVRRPPPLAPKPSHVPDMAADAPVDLATPPANLAVARTSGLSDGNECLADPVCRASYDKAVTLFEKGKFEEALAGFQEAYTRRQAHWLLINIGRTMYRLGRSQEALSYYERFKQAETRADAETTERLNKYIEQAKALLPTSVALHPEMVPIRSGRFQMGSPASGTYDDEKPQREVHIQTPFLMSVTEVTQAQYQAVMGENPSDFKDGADAPNRPVERVSWLDAVRYCNKLSQREKLESCYVISGDRVEWPKRQGCTGYRLPTEAEWEYAARAGEAWEYAGSKSVDEVAWYRDNSDRQTHAVGTTRKKSNRWGLSDMSGNVWEWVWDWYQDSYNGASSTDPTGPSVGGNRVRRGGSFVNEAGIARVAYRSRNTPSDRSLNVGFRLARSNP